MTIQTDENLQLFIEESLEHLADIETDLLTIEESGADIDEELVNKVFRAAHSIKGGAGFMGLANIKELSHKMENVLGMIRSRELVPNPEIVNQLLLASDTLRDLLSNSSTSNDTDISNHIEALTAIASGTLPDSEKESVSKEVNISMPGENVVFRLSEYDIFRCKKENKYIYLIEFDLIHDVQRKNRTPLNLISEITKGGTILDSKILIEAAGALEDDAISNRLPFVVLFATILEPNMVSALVEVDEKYIYQLEEDMTLKPLGAPVLDDNSETKKENTVELDIDSLDSIEIMEEESPPVDIEITPEEDSSPPGSQNGARREVTAEAQKLSTPEVKTTQSMPNKERSRPAALSKQAPVKKTENLEKSNLRDMMRTVVSPERSLRVSVNLLDSLMNLAGELVLGRNQLLRAIASKDLRKMEVAGQRLDLITTDLQEAIMLTRMQPIGSVFNKFPRVVRDLARSLGKQVELVLDGKEVELDKTIIEAISDPLTHLVRNCVDHGIEPPEERKRVGKPPIGKVKLKAYHEAGQVNIEISDDGKGIDGNKLALAAVYKGLLPKDRIQTMSDKEKIDLIFLPGFSTAEQVTDVSGRGVGMDVVKTNLDKLGGIIDIDSEVGKGTTIRIKLPLTLAIIPSQIVSTGGERFAIPQVNMDELLRIPASQVRDRVERVGDAEVVRLRGNLLPLLSLAEVLGIQKTYVDPKDGEIKPDRRKNLSDMRVEKKAIFYGNGYDKDSVRHDVSIDSIEDRRFHCQSAVNIVVVTTGSLKYGLVVDALHDSEEIVVKPLGRHLNKCKGYAGATIMGDGRVALILDIVGLAQMADLATVERTDYVVKVDRQEHKKMLDSQTLLIFRNAEEQQFAVPLGLVQRIEKIKRSDIEEVGGKRVIQYRGGSLPLAAVEEVANVKPLADSEDLMVIVFLIAGREAGLLATGPVDAIDVKVGFDDSTLKQPGIMGSTIIDGQTTLLIDIYDIMKTIYPQWFTERDDVIGTDGTGLTILYAEDSNFFRQQIKNFLTQEGYKIIDAENGLEAWKLLEQYGDRISLVITDLEMPELDGYGLTEKIRKDERFSNLPIIALTTLAGEEDIERGKSIGITEYQVKLDKEQLMNSIYELLKAA